MLSRDSFFKGSFGWLAVKTFFINYGEVNRLPFFSIGLGASLSIFCLGVSTKVEG